MSHLKSSQHLKIPFKEIETGTKNFQEFIGKGGYGLVYKGELLIAGKPTTVAIKRLDEQFGQGLKEFLTEIQLLTGQHHPNLISLLGYCDEGKEKIIVYEYADRGSLDRYLRRTNTIYTLTWMERLKICVDAARGLDHLHNHVGAHQTIIHRDIKSSNILIDQNWVAKISDLGLSKLSLAGLNRSAVVSHACGTPGYCEQEYISTGIVTKESDVYSFGIVLFEVVCGRLCTIRDDDGLLLSGPLAKQYYKEKKLDVIVDPGLSKQMHSDSMNKFLAIAYGCLHKDRARRPSMDLVVKELEESLEIQKRLEEVQLALDRITISATLDVDLDISWGDVALKEKIGAGTLGTVYRANWKGSDVAVKILLEQYFPPERLKEFLGEVAIMSRLRHPNIVLLKGIVTRPPNMSIVTEFSRHNLYTFLRITAGVIKDWCMLRMALGVAEGMNYLHTRQPPIVHGYLKSTNVLVVGETGTDGEMRLNILYGRLNFTMKVSDFGLSSLKANAFLSSNEKPGTWEWMAPEVLRGEPSNEKSDVYSFGVILWELATLKKPWSHLTRKQAEVLIGTDSERLKIPREVNYRVATLIRKCLAE